ncbi:MAG: hypothetical protein QS99_C0005G0001, partial [archaeon GW2011_AR4]
MTKIAFDVMTAERGIEEAILYGACRIEEVLKQRGFSISHRQIEKVLIKKGL